MTIAPSTSPILVKRRLTPSNFSNPAMMASSPSPSSQRDGDGGKRILDIVPPGDRDVDAFDHPPLAVAIEDRDIETAAARHRRDIVGADVGERGESIGDDAPVADAAMMLCTSG